MKLKKFDELYSISPGNIPNQGIMFVDHSKQNRSGHLGHALIQCKNFDILAFYPDCSNDGKGHSAVGWMKYKRSGDFGKTWGPSFDLTYSKNMIGSRENMLIDLQIFKYCTFDHSDNSLATNPKNISKTF